MIYVTRRAFKSAGIYYAVGSVITDPTAVKMFKSKLKEKRILEVTDTNLAHFAEYLKVRMGVDFTPVWQAALEPVVEPVVEPAKPKAAIKVSISK